MTAPRTFSGRMSISESDLQLRGCVSFRFMELAQILDRLSGFLRAPTRCDVAVPASIELRVSLVGNPLTGSGRSVCFALPVLESDSLDYIILHRLLYFAVSLRG